MISLNPSWTGGKLNMAMARIAVSYTAYGDKRHAFGLRGHEKTRKQSFAGFRILVRGYRTHPRRSHTAYCTYIFMLAVIDYRP